MTMRATTFQVEGSFKSLLQVPGESSDARFRPGSWMRLHHQHEEHARSRHGQLRCALPARVQPPPGESPSQQLEHRVRESQSGFKSHSELQEPRGSLGRDKRGSGLASSPGPGGRRLANSEPAGLGLDSGLQVGLRFALGRLPVARGKPRSRVGWRRQGELGAGSNSGPLRGLQTGRRQGAGPGAG